MACLLPPGARRPPRHRPAPVYPLMEVSRHCGAEKARAMSANAPTIGLPPCLLISCGRQGGDMAKRAGKPSLSADGQAAVAAYADYLHHERDLSGATRRNYLSDVWQFAAWC